MGIKRRIGFFPGGLDAFFSRHWEVNIEPICLTAEDTREDSWVKESKTNHLRIHYRVDFPLDDFVYASSEIIFMHSDLLKVLQANHIGYFFISSRCTRTMEKIASDHGIQLIGTTSEFMYQMEDKIIFDKFLQEHDLPKPPSEIISNLHESQLLTQGKVVVQEALSWGGEGTFFINDQKDAEDLIERNKEFCSKKNDFLIRKYINGQSLGISVLILPDQIVLSSLRMQCFYPETFNHLHLFAGIQWVPTIQFSPLAQLRINTVFLRIGKLLHQQKYFGFANFDFILNDQDEIFLIECNARLSAASTQMVLFPELINDVNFICEMASAFVDHRSYTDTPITRLLPVTKFNGALVEYNFIPTEQKTKVTISQQDLNGFYSLDDGETIRTRYLDPFTSGLSDLIFFLYTDVQSGQSFSAVTTVGRIITNFPLFDDQGVTNKMFLSLQSEFYPELAFKSRL